MSFVRADEPRKLPPEPGTVAPPKRAATPPGKPVGKPAAAKKAVPLASKNEIEKWFLKTYMMLGTGLMMVKPVVASQVMESAPKCAASMADLCMESPQLRKAISGMMVAGKYGAVFAAHLPIILVLVAEYRPDNAEMLQGLATVMSSGDALETAWSSAFGFDSEVPDDASGLS